MLLIVRSILEVAYLPSVETRLIRTAHVGRSPTKRSDDDSSIGLSFRLLASAWHPWCTTPRRAQHGRYILPFSRRIGRRGWGMRAGRHTLRHHQKLAVAQASTP